ncbi:MAG: DUF3579 domain-containing protein [Gammaproteobacteria bacterium]
MNARVIVIHGKTADGRTFRPSDWTERLYYAVASYGPHGQVTFNPFVTIKMTEDSRCVVIDTRLREQDPIVFSFVTGFARDNQLQMFDQDDRPIAAPAARMAA